MVVCVEAEAGEVMAGEGTMLTWAREATNLGRSRDKERRRRQVC